MWFRLLGVFFFQAEDGIRDLVRSRGLGDVYKRQVHYISESALTVSGIQRQRLIVQQCKYESLVTARSCLLYTSDAADERSSVDLGGSRIIKKKTNSKQKSSCLKNTKQHISTKPEK